MTNRINTYLFGASMVALTFSLNISNAFAAGCTAMPSCESLGYTDTTNDCGSGVPSLKCPFDQSKVKCICDVATYPLSTCDDSKGECYKCAGKYKYEYCLLGYTMNTSNKQCEVTDCSAFPYTSRNDAAAHGCDRYDPSMEEGGSNVCYSGGLNNARYKCSFCMRGVWKSDGTCNPTYNVGDTLYYKGTAIGLIIRRGEGASLSEGNLIIALALQNASANKVKFATSVAYVRDEMDFDFQRGTCQEKWNDLMTGIAPSMPYQHYNISHFPATQAISNYAPNVCPSGSPCGKGKWIMPSVKDMSWLSSDGDYSVANISYSVWSTGFWTTSLTSLFEIPGGNNNCDPKGEVYSLTYGIDNGYPTNVEETAYARGVLELDPNASYMKDFY